MKDSTKCRQGCGAPDLSYTTGGVSTDIWENYLAVSTKVKHMLPYDQQFDSWAPTPEKYVHQNRASLFKAWAQTSSIGFT